MTASVLLDLNELRPGDGAILDRILDALGLVAIRQGEGSGFASVMIDPDGPGAPSPAVLAVLLALSTALEASRRDRDADTARLGRLYDGSAAE